MCRHSNNIIREEFVRCALLIVMSDGYVNAAEDELLRAAATWLGVNHENFEHMWREVGSGARHSSTHDHHDRDEGEDDAGGRTTQTPVAPSDLATYYAGILGVTVSATPAELRRAYLQKAKQYHPDTVAHRGPVFTAEAESRFKEVSRAYEFFRGTVAT